MTGHTDIKSQFAKGMAGIVLHALDILVLVKAVSIVGKYRNDGSGQYHRQDHCNHQFNQAEAQLAVS